MLCETPKELPEIGKIHSQKESYDNSQSTQKYKYSNIPTDPANETYASALHCLYWLPRKTGTSQASKPLLCMEEMWPVASRALWRFIGPDSSRVTVATSSFTSKKALVSLGEVDLFLW